MAGTGCDNNFSEYPDCADCDGKCCRYVAVEIDRPRAKRDYDHIRWYLLHENIVVYIDRGGQWFVEFRARCVLLRKDYRCGRYADRPRICQQHNTGNEVCERYEPEPYRTCFNDVHQFENYLDKRGIDWRFKGKHAGG